MVAAAGMVDEACMTGFWGMRCHSMFGEDAAISAGNVF